MNLRQACRLIWAGLLTLLAASVLISGCGSQKTPAQGSTPAAGTDRAGKTITIGMSLPESDNPFYVTIRRYAEEYARLKGVKLVVAIANRDTGKQLNDVEDFIQTKVDGIIISPVDAKGSVAAFEEAAKAGIPVFTVARKAETDKYVAFIGTDDVNTGRLAGEYIGRALGEAGGKLIILHGPAGATYADLQQTGLLEALKNFPKVKVVANQAGADTRAAGLQLMEDLLQSNPDVNAVYASNDELALGAVAALEGARKTNVVVTGSNGNAAALQAIRDGKMSFTVLKSPGQYPVLAIDGILDYMKGKRNFQKDIYAFSTGVSKDNLASLTMTWNESDPAKIAEKIKQSMAK